MAKGRKQKPAQLDCTEIGCMPNLSESEFERSEGWWLHYEKHAGGGKLWKFAIQLTDGIVHHQQWLDGSKAKPVSSRFASAELARQEFLQLIADKKRDGYHFVAAKW